MRERERLILENIQLRRVGGLAARALRTFEEGMGTPDLARRIAGDLELVLAQADQADLAERPSEAAEGRA